MEVNLIGRRLVFFKCHGLTFLMRTQTMIGCPNAFKTVNECNTILWFSVASRDIQGFAMGLHQKGIA